MHRKDDDFDCCYWHKAAITRLRERCFCQKVVLWALGIVLVFENIVFLLER